MLGIFKYFMRVFCFYFIRFKSKSELKNIACLGIIQRKSFNMRPVTYKFPSSKLYRPAHND